MTAVRLLSRQRVKDVASHLFLYTRRLRGHLLIGTDVQVATYCRICAAELVIFLPIGYTAAVEECYAIDDSVTSHGSHDDKHTENGGWGVHLRLDEVLELLFPEHRNDEGFWPKPPWYEYEEGEEKRPYIVKVLDRT
jgi:hypothetical protein